MTAPAELRAVKIVHTFAWALFAGCIVALPIVAWRKDFIAAIALIAVVTVFGTNISGWFSKKTGQITTV